MSADPTLSADLHQQPTASVLTPPNSRSKEGGSVTSPAHVYVGRVDPTYEAVESLGARSDPRALLGITHGRPNDAKQMKDEAGNDEANVSDGDDDHPNDATDDLRLVKLTKTRNKEAQHRRYTRAPQSLLLNDVDLLRGRRRT